MASDTAAPEAASKPGRQPRLVSAARPDKAASDAAFAALGATVEEHLTQLASLDAQIKEKTAARKAGAAPADLSTTKQRLAELHATFKAKVVRATAAGERAPLSGPEQAERDALKEELAASDMARDRAREDVKAQRGALKFRSEAEVVAEVARLEYALSHTTMPLAEEKKLLLQIKELNKSKDAVKAVAEQQGKLGGDEAARRDLAGRVKAKDAEITAVGAERAGVSAALNELRAAEEAKGSVFRTDALRAERDAVWAALKAARTQQREARNAFKAANDAWWAREQEVRAQAEAERQKKCVRLRARCALAARRAQPHPLSPALLLSSSRASACSPAASRPLRARWLEAQAERKARADARRAFEEENAPPPYAAELAMCDQLGAYLNTLAPDEPGSAAAAAAATAAATAAAAAATAASTAGAGGGGVAAKRTADAPPGQLMRRKADDDAAAAKYAVGSSKKGSAAAAAAKKNGAASLTAASASPAPAASANGAPPPAPPPPAPPPAASTRALTHSLDGLSTFSKIGLSPPLRLCDVAASKAAVAAKRARYAELAAAVLAKRDKTKTEQDKASKEGRAYAPPPPGDEEGLLVSVRLVVGTTGTVALDLVVL